MLAIGWLLSLVVAGVWLAGLPASRPEDQKPKTERADILRARGLIIVDEKGVERIVMGAPVPDPPQGKRVAPGNGIVFQDAKGRERGGIGVLDDGRIVYALDSEKCDRVGLFVFPGGQSGLMINDDNMNGRIALVTEPDGTSKLRFYDGSGKERMVLGVAKDGTAAIEVKDADEKTVFKAP